jgi:hypothetical protein
LEKFTNEKNAEFEVLRAVVMNVAPFWDIVPCSLHVPEVSKGHITCVFKVQKVDIASCSADFLP